MAKLNRNINLTLLLGLKGKGIDEATKDLKRLGKQVDQLSSTVVSAAAGFAAFAAGRKMIEFGGAAIEEARDLNRNMAGLASVFQEVTPQMVEFSRTASDLGLSMNEAAKSSTFIGSVLKQSGFSISETADLTERLVGLGADLAITYGYDIQEALLGMTALFRGEYDPIEKFGVAMKQNEINIALVERGMGNLTGAARRLAEQQIRVEFLFDRASDALGQYSAQAGTLFVAQQQLRAEFENVQAVVGYALTPAFAELAVELRPLIQELIPVMVAIFSAIIPVVKDLAANKEQLVAQVLSVAKAFLVVTQTIAAATSFVINNIEAIKNLVVFLGAVALGTRIWYTYAAGVKLANSAMIVLTGGIIRTTKALRALKIAVAATGFGLIAVGVGIVATSIMNATDDIDESLADLEAGLQEFDMSTFEQEAIGATAIVDDINGALEETGSAAGKATDAVGDFFRSLANDAAKLSARVQLESLGASEGLIEKILGSGEDWYKVFEQVTREGMASVERVQAMFLQTAAGFDEAMDAWQEEFDAFKDFEKQALEAGDAFKKFVREFTILPSIAEDLGQFERSAVDTLQRFEDRLNEAFDNGYLLEESHRNLLNYARDEFAVLRQIERQRDQLLARRDAAAALISQVQQSVATSANIVRLFDEVQDTANNVDVVEFARRTVSAGDELREFRTALITNFSDPIEQAGSKAQKLVQSYRSVVERTREFVENLKALRALGLDPMLFNQLIDAGVEAGGATAQALVEGGADTITEVNGLFAELDALGQELGENTAQVMYGQGELFVDGIVSGLESQLAELESSANSLAEAFTTTFEDVLIAGIDRAIAAAEAALRRMPSVPGFTPPTVTTTTTTTTTQTGSKLPVPLATPLPQQSILAQALQNAPKFKPTPSYGPGEGFYPTRTIMPRDVFSFGGRVGGETTVNLYSPSASIIRNATASANNSGGSSFQTPRNNLSGRV